jgi:hypothetical protein
MTQCQHAWKMTNAQYGFTVFERCSHCHGVRTYYAAQDTWDEYREGGCTWSIVENAQTLRFDLECEKCQQQVDFKDLMGLMYCTSCMEDCEVECAQKALAPQKTWILAAFGFLPHAPETEISAARLEILTDYFNQRRDTSRSRVKILPFSLIKQVSLCHGELIHDIGMLSPEPFPERKPLF